MPWPRPRRTLCVLCLASCETVVSPFGIGTGTGVMPVQGTLMRGGTTGRDLRMTGLEDGSGRRGVPPVQAAVAEAGIAPTTAVPPVAGGEGKRTISEEDEPESVAPPPPKAPKLPSIQNGESTPSTVVNDAAAPVTLCPDSPRPFSCDLFDGLSSAYLAGTGTNR